MVQFSRNLIRAFLVIILVSFGINGCKDDYTSVIPYVYVNYTLNPSNIIELNVPGGSVYIPNVGYGGLLVFRDLVDSSNPFLAYDAACTYEVLSSVRVVSDGSGLATCPVCKSQFLLFSGSGSPSKAPASQPLKQYHTYYSGGLITIRN
jgi:nitrite reductase/ring-hydroxylating ferredoxin subunit